MTARRLLRACEWVRYPIEQVFAKLKTLLRKTVPHTIEAAWRGIGAHLDRSMKASRASGT